jgi:hypothetical protein
LIKYLLDELYTYKGDHCDALNPFDSLDSVVRKAGEQGEVNPMCSLELRSRLEDLQLQNKTHQRRIEERYQTCLVQQQIKYYNLSHDVNKLSQLLRSPSLQLEVQLESNGSQGLSNHSQHFSARRYHPYSQALAGPGIVFNFSKFNFDKSADQVY